MAVTRISTNYAFIRSMQNLSDTVLRMDSIQERMNTGKNINRPSDDPVGLQKVFSLGTSIKESERYIQNIDDGLSRLDATSTILSQVEDLLNEIMDIATGSASSIVTSAERIAQAEQIELLLGELVSLANTKHQNKFIFGGTHTLSGTSALPLAFNIQYDSDGCISGVVANGNVNTLIYTTVLPGTRDSVNISGAAAFQPNGAGESGDIFDIVVTLRRNLLNNDIDAIKASSTDLDNAYMNVVEQNTIVGAKINKLEVAQDTLEAIKTNETGAKSQVEDSDYAALLIEYQTAEVLLNATLSATSSLLQNSLINFL